MYQLPIKNEDLDVGQCHEVFGDVNNKLVHESWGNVESIQLVVQVVPKINYSKTHSMTKIYSSSN